LCAETHSGDAQVEANEAAAAAVRAEPAATR
jgi:hypothetical protein